MTAFCFPTTGVYVYSVPGLYTCSGVIYVFRDYIRVPGLCTCSGVPGLYVVILYPVM